MSGKAKQEHLLNNFTTVLEQELGKPEYGLNLATKASVIAELTSLATLQGRDLSEVTATYTALRDEHSDVPYDARCTLAAELTRSKLVDRK